MANSISLGSWRVGLHITYSKSSPSGLDVPVRRACFPSTLSMVEYLQNQLARASHELSGSFTSTCRTRSCSIPMRVPALQSASSYTPISSRKYRLTGPTRSGMYSSSSTTFPNMKKNPSNVTRFGAIHNGRSSTKPFHCVYVRSCCGVRDRDGAYVVLEDVAGDEGFIDARVFVRFQMLQRIFRDALMRRSF